MNGLSASKHRLSEVYRITTGNLHSTETGTCRVERRINTPVATYRARDSSFWCLEENRRIHPSDEQRDILGTYSIENEKHVRLVNLSDGRRALNLYHTVPVAGSQGEEYADGAAAGGTTNVGGGAQYHRVPSSEHTSC